MNESSARRLKRQFLPIMLAPLLLSACDNNNTVGSEAKRTYTFESRFVAGESSVAYNGQTCRHTLITALTNAIKDEAEIAGAEYRGSSVPYFDDTIAGDLAAQSTEQILGTPLPVLSDQDTLGELCGTSFLKQKFAGNDTVTDWKDWNTQFQGVNGEVSAEAYLRRLLTEVSNQALNGTHPAGNEHYVSATGIDYSQMIQKFLLGALVFAQGTDDYLGDDFNTPGKGLYASNAQSGTSPYSGLEHVWDEGFGYFGAARDYLSRTDEVNRTGVVDDNGDGFIDVRSEHNFGASTNAAKRDVGADPSTPTDFTATAFNAFIQGRTLITDTGVDFSAMTDAQRTELVSLRNAAVDAWEAAIVATVVHYINDTLADLGAIGAGPATAAQLADLAKHYSEMKGFALGLQFNRLSPINLEDTANPGQSLFVTLHELLRDQPTLTDDATYRANLLEARSLLGNLYGFSQANIEGW